MLKFAAMKFLPLFLFVFTAMACSMIRSATTPRPDDSKAVKIPIADLIRSYKDNEVSADKQFRGKTIETRGMIRNISTTLGISYLYLGTNYADEMVTVSCQLIDDREALGLRPGQSVTVVGIGNGMTGGVTVDLSDCFIKELPKML